VCICGYRDMSCININIIPLFLFFKKKAMKIDSVPEGCSMQFIGKLEFFESSMNALFPYRRLVTNKHSSSGNVYKSKFFNSLNLGDDEVIRMCDLLMVDYVCFDFTLPEVCSQHGGGRGNKKLN
jgi:hypothetical protein